MENTILPTDSGITAAPAGAVQPGDTLFDGTTVVGLISMWTMAAIMNQAIQSTENSQALTQQLQEGMTINGLKWSNLYSTALTKFAGEISAIAADPKLSAADKTPLINAKTTSFNKTNADAQAASAFTSSLNNSTSSALSNLVQAMQIDMNNIQAGVDQLLRTISEIQH